jgi:uncharacterized protein YajQ (UPF0234 family)
MAKDNSFDIVSKTDMAEVLNAVNQATAEIKQRYDFKGSKSEISLDQKARVITILTENDIKLRNVIDILQTKLVRREISLKALNYGTEEKAAGDMVRQVISIQDGIPTDKAKEVVKLIKGSKIKVQASIQQDQVRVSGKKRDDLQAVMALLKESDLDIDMQFENYR